MRGFDVERQKVAKQIPDRRFAHHHYGEATQDLTRTVPRSSYGQVFIERFEPEGFFEILGRISATFA